MSLCIQWRRLTWLVAMPLVTACGARVHPPPPSDTTRVSPAVVLRPSSILPIYAEDLSRGAPSAPITVVAFLDLECPFCAAGWDTLSRVQGHFGTEKVRVVVKHLPLPFHAHARAAAQRALELQRTRGDAAAFALLHQVFQAQPQLSEAALDAWTEQSRTMAPSSPARTASLSVEEQLQRDAVLAVRLGIDGTPEFRINGISLAGAVGEAEFERVIEAELAKVQELVRAGMPAGDVYPSRVAANHPSESPAPANAAELDPTRWRIPIGNSPQLGASNAPVTVVAFMDYECPFCRRGFATMQELRSKYPGQLRLVWKHRPLDFHAHAEAASTLAIGVRKTRGDDAFWKVTEQLLSGQDDLAHCASWPSLQAFGVDQTTLESSAFKLEARQILAEDADLAEDFEVDGTPQFFVNGRRVKGSRSVEDFSQLIEQELQQAESLRQSGTHSEDIYDVLMNEAQKAPEPPTVAEGTKFPQGPSAGAKSPKVTIRIFSDYQCPFCRRAESTIGELLKEHPSELRVVWYDLPLAFHERARPAATVAREVRAQRGDEAFFRMNHLLFERQSDLSEPALTKYAAEIGIEGSALAPTQREHAHGAAIDRDIEFAHTLGVSATPTFVVERFILEGAQSKDRFERLIRRVLSEKVPTHSNKR